MIIISIFLKRRFKLFGFFEFDISDEKSKQKQREGKPKQTKPVAVDRGQIFASGNAGKNKGKNEWPNNCADLIYKFGYAKPQTRSDLFGGMGGDSIAGRRTNTLANSL